MSPTPLLDRLKPVPSPKRTSTAAIIAIGAAIGLVGAFAGESISDALPAFRLVSPLVFLVAFFLCILLHELGHLVAGVAVGLEFRRFMAGPFMLSKESRGYRFRFVPSRALSGGHVQVCPRSTEDLSRRFAIFAAGGPAVTALLFLPVIRLPWSTSTVCLLLANTLLAASSWIPLVTRGAPTDARLILSLVQPGPSSERLAAILYLLAVDSGGTEPQRWPKEVVDKLALAPAGGAFRAAGRIFLHIHVRDAAEPEETAVALEHVLVCAGELRPDLRRIYFTEAAYFQGVCRKNAALARTWLEDARKVKGALSLEDWDSAALAAIALAEGDQPKAREHLGRAIAVLDRMPGTHGSVSTARARLAALMDRAAAPTV